MLGWIVVAALLATQLVAPAYLLMMRKAARRATPARTPKRWPHVTVILATHNEAATLRRRLDNLSAVDYPSFDILIVDSGSTDGTPDLARANAGPRVRVVVERERRGKAAALRRAFAMARGEIVALTDADCLWERGALRAAVARLQTPGVGAVTGVQSLVVTVGAAQRMEARYASFYEALRRGESALDSTPVFRGELAVFRREVVADADVGNVAPLADDSELAVKTRRLGWRAVVEPDARFLEMAPPTLASRARQKRRRGAGLLQVFLRNADVAVRPRRYGWFGLACAAHLLMLVAAPLALAILPLALWLTGGAKLLVVAGALGLAGFVAAPATVASFVQSQLALLAALPTALRPGGTWEPISEVREAWARL